VSGGESTDVPVAAASARRWSSLLDWTEDLDRRVIALVCGATALVARAAYWAWATPDRELLSDASQYHFLATNLAEGRGFVDTFPQLELHATAFRPPAYPFVLSLAYRVLGTEVWVGRALNIGLGIAVVVVLSLLLARQLGHRAAFLGGVAAALMPNLVANDTYVLTEPLSLLLLTILLWQILEDRWLPAGLVCGLLVLTRPSAQYLALVIALWIFMRIGWRRALGFLAVTALIIAPWIGRNWVVMGSPVLVTSNGFNFAAMYSPPAIEVGAFVDPVFNSSFDDQALDRFDEVVWDRNLRELGVRGMLSDPLVVPRVVARNLIAYVELQPSFNAYAEAADGRSEPVKYATLPFFYVVAVAGVIGCWRQRHQPIVIGAVLFGAYFSLASLVFVAPPRLRSPLDLMLCIGVGALVARSRRGELGEQVPEPGPGSTGKVIVPQR
jgi:4-amino-4-deoxy-L-arabinose transferase-like glycosyltransferase